MTPTAMHSAQCQQQSAPTPEGAPTRPSVPAGSPARRASAWLTRHGWARLSLLLAAPLTWLVLVYVVALASLLVTALWSVDSFTSEIDRTWSVDNIVTVVTGSLYQVVTVRTVTVAVVVTIIDVLIALPIAFFMAKVASPRVRRLLVIAVLTPLWASYLVKAFAWRSILSEGGLVEWLGSAVGVHSPGYGLPAVVITQAYIWLPYVILPIFAGLERVPDSVLNASSDLGARPRQTVTGVLLPLLYPAIIAGAIFSFSLTLGDYITVNIVGGASQMLGNLIYLNAGAANNLPLAAAIALIPIAVIVIFLGAVKRTGALNHL